MNFAAAIRWAVACTILVTSANCGTTPTQPAPVYDLKTETFSGSLNTGGGAHFPFSVVNPGDINVTITQMSPASNLTVGLALGSWEATTEVCTDQLSTSASVNIAYAASPSGAGNYCVRIFDSGNVQAQTEFTLSVTHY